MKYRMDRIYHDYPETSCKSCLAGLSLLLSRRLLLQRLGPPLKRRLQWLKQFRPETVLLLVPGLQLLFRVSTHRRLELSLLQRVFQREMVVLRNQREHERDKITLE